jgi:hypothetical protein
MDQTSIVIIGFMGPLIAICIVGIFVMLYINKKEQSQP